MDKNQFFSCNQSGMCFRCKDSRIFTVNTWTFLCKTKKLTLLGDRGVVKDSKGLEVVGKTKRVRNLDRGHFVLPFRFL